MFGRRHLDDLHDDIADHLARETQDHIDRGLPPEEARLAALRAFGSVARTAEDTRAVWVPLWLDQLGQDLRFGWRMLRRDRAFSSIVVLTLAIGLGLNTAVFSVVNAVLVRPLSYPHADRLLWLTMYDEGRPFEGVPSPQFVEWRDRATTVEQMAGLSISAEPIDVGAEVVQARAAAVTDGFWDLTGARFAFGGPPPAGQEGVVLSHAFFATHFGADPAVVGRTIVRYGVRSTVTGVLRPDFHVQLPPPPWFAGLGPGDVELYRSIVFRPVTVGGGVMLLDVIGRAKAGVPIARVRSELESIRWSPPGGGLRLPAHVRVLPYAEKLVGDTRAPLLILLGAVALVLVIACVNIASLLLARGSARQREIAIRTAIGAGHGRVVRQFLAESLLLAAIGGAAGLLLARGAIAVVIRLIPLAVPRLAETSIDGRVLAFTAAATLITALVCGLAPALSGRRASVITRLKNGVRTTAGGGLRARMTLVAIELAMSVVLLVGAGLMVRSFQRITAYPAGFNPDRILTMRLRFSGPRYREQPARRAHLDELLRRVREAPGVEAAGVNSDGDSRMALFIDGAPPVPREQRPEAALTASSSGYARVVGMRVVRGRWFADDESAAAFVVNETLARQAFRDQDPIGRRIRLPWANETGFGTVVGIVADLRYATLGAEQQPEIFVDYAHAGLFSMTLAIRTAGDPVAAAPAIRTLLAGVDRTQPLFDVKPLDVALAESISQRRFNTLLLGTFAVCAILLAVVGIYGVIAYSVAQRTQEIGVRMALGAQRRAVVGLVVRQGMAIALAGLAAGLVAALASSRVIAGLLYDVAPTDAATYAVVAGALTATALAACLGPALRAARVDPLLALRCE